MALFGMSGCAGWPQPEIHNDIPAGLRPILAPTVVQRWTGKPSFVIDTHGHFFNARDVPVKGYLAGPVAHSKTGALRELIKALAPISDWLAFTAPSAKGEFDQLIARARQDKLAAKSLAEVRDDHGRERDQYLSNVSEQFFAQAQKEAPEFVARYNALAERPFIANKGRSVQGPLRPDSLARAMRSDERRAGPTLQSLDALEPAEYGDGVLAFVGYMLSYRWMNLLAYQQSYTSEPGSFGVNQVLGALVDFDYWLTPPPPRSAQEDQIKLHQLLSVLSNGYMRPIAAYNPWKDVQDKGTTRARVIAAIRDRGFVGAKMYPPNGFRPYGNEELPLPAGSRIAGMPTGKELDVALLETWRELGVLNVPMMAHSGHSMGKDAIFDAMAGPEGYERLCKASSSAPPHVHLGHFGGDDDQFPWSATFAELMEKPGCSRLYGDLAYWDSLRCPKGPSNCATAMRLKKAIAAHPDVANRLMYGSDWLMLSQERRWDRYPFDLHDATNGILDQEALFSGNARRCYPRLQPPIA